MGAAQKVVRRRVLVKRKIQRGCLLHDHQLDPHRYFVLEQLLRDVPEGAQKRGDGKERQLDDDQDQDHLDRRECGRVQLPEWARRVEAREGLAVGLVEMVDGDPLDDGVGQELRRVGCRGGNNTGDRGRREQG